MDLEPVPEPEQVYIEWREAASTDTLNRDLPIPKNTSREHGLDLKGITDVFNSYATKKTFTTGFFNIALVINCFF